jgi:N-acetylglucosaminyl-diphospho-decaprenol L-rhamnosyltransferase
MAEAVTVVIVTYRSAGTIEACVKSLAVQADGVIVVDNASNDDTVALARAAGAEIVERALNGGFAKANNEGLGLVETDWVLFANPDTQWPVGTVDALVGVAAGRPDAGIVSPGLVSDGGELQPSVERFLRLRDVLLAMVRLRRPIRPASPPSGGGPVEVDWTHGAALLMPTALARKLGGWDERFFLFAEDMDLCARVRDAGFKVLVAPDVRVHHAGGTSMDLALGSSSTAGYRVTALGQYIEKHQGKWARRAYGVTGTVVYGLRGLFGSRQHRSMAAAAARHVR